MCVRRTGDGRGEGDTIAGMLQGASDGHAGRGSVGCSSPGNSSRSRISRSSREEHG